MNKSSRVVLAWLAVSAAFPLGVYLYLMNFPGKDRMYADPSFHFFFMSPTFTLSGVSAALIGWVGIRLRNTNVLLLALAMVSLLGFFLIHGLTTQGFIIPNAYHVPEVTSQLALTSCALWMLLSTARSDRFIICFIAHHRRTLIVGWIALMATLNVVALLDPEIADFIPVDSYPLRYVFGSITIALFLFTAARYFRQFRFARFKVQRSVMVGAVMLAVTQVIMVTTMMWTLAWWFYHAMLIVSTWVILFGMIAEYKSGRTLTETFQLMFSKSPLERIRTGISPAIQSMIMATERKDHYTAGHNFRVAMYALQLADELEIGPELLRALAQGGVVHDVGKTAVPGEILNKPGRLTEQERKVIELHPVTGYDMCKKIGFMKQELEVVRHHHEKWDGTGYPDRLKGEEIPFLARILAVADVYDALTSHRAYREPWSQERALSVIEEGAGSHFDPVCANAWVHLCTSGRLEGADTEWEYSS